MCGFLLLLLLLLVFVLFCLSLFVVVQVTICSRSSVFRQAYVQISAILTDISGLVLRI